MKRNTFMNVLLWWNDMVTAIIYSSEYSENVMLQTNRSNTVNRPRYLNSVTPRHHRCAWAIEACLIASLLVTFAVGWSVREKWSVPAWSSSTLPQTGDGRTGGWTDGRTVRSWYLPHAFRWRNVMVATSRRQANARATTCISGGA